MEKSIDQNEIWKRFERFTQTHTLGRVEETRMIVKTRWFQAEENVNEDVDEDESDSEERRKSSESSSCESGLSRSISEESYEPRNMYGVRKCLDCGSTYMTTQTREEENTLPEGVIEIGSCKVCGKKIWETREVQVADILFSFPMFQ